jgi:hypothetical protein
VCDTGRLSSCLECGGDEIRVVDPVHPGRTLAYVCCLGCGTAVMGDTTERAVWIWNLPRPTGPSPLQ